MNMFTPEDRQKIRAFVLNRAKNDHRISGGAITGSASISKEDQWSDIDLAFGVKKPFDLNLVIQDYTEEMYSSFGAIHHLDVVSGAWIYRVFFLSNTLQVDLAFVNEEHFGARAATFKLEFGQSNQLQNTPQTPKEVVVGWCWLYALHVRSSLKRDNLWQAEFFVGAMRSQLVMLYCHRFGLPEKEGRGVDRLPSEIKQQLEDTLVKSMHANELQRAFESVADLFVEELRHVDGGLQQRLVSIIRALCNLC